MVNPSLFKKSFHRGWTTIFEGPQASFKARKLSEATVYYFRVVAVNISGRGGYSDVIQEKTAYSQPPPVEGERDYKFSNLNFLQCVF